MQNSLVAGAKMSDGDAANTAEGNVSHLLYLLIVAFCTVMCVGV